MPSSARRARGRAGGCRRARGAPSVGGALRGALRCARPRRGLLLIAAVLLLGGSAAAAALIAGERSRSLSGSCLRTTRAATSRSRARATKSRLGPSLEPGSIGWCTWIQFRDVPSLRARGGGGMGGGGCGGGTPAVGSPLFGPDGDRGPGLWYVLTAPQVAAVRVANGPTVLTRVRCAVAVRLSGGGLRAAGEHADGSRAAADRARRGRPADTWQLLRDAAEGAGALLAVTRSASRGAAAR